MEKIEDGGPAFPIQPSVAPDSREPVWGLTKRDYFAAAALTGLLANETVVGQMALASKTDEQATEAFSVWAFQYGDAMLKQSAQTEKGGRGK